MKIFIITMLLSLSVFAGGDILPVDPISKFEKMENYFMDNYVEDEEVENNAQPIVLNHCVTTCGEPAKILAYYGEDLPLAMVTPCLEKLL